jgi:phosphate butyryltransferase
LFLFACGFPPSKDFVILDRIRQAHIIKPHLKMLKKLSELQEMARGHARKKLVLVAAHEEHALEAVVHAARKDIIEGILIGDQAKIEHYANARGFDLGVFRRIDQPDNDQAAAEAVKMVRNKEADILMKGNIGTGNLLKAVLNKEYGLRTGELISHLALFELDRYHKIIGLTDAAMNIAPDLSGKISIIRNAVDYFRKLGVEQPKVAVLCAVETVKPEMKSTVEAAILSKMGERRQIKNCLIDGPLAFDNAISAKSASLKCIDSPVAGDADILVADNIDAANALYKSFVYFACAKAAAVILGAAAPIVLTSRSDNDETKLNSIALAAAVN